MLTALEVENFKGICARQRVDFAPVTLLFGANSAGKSTILHALIYLHELLERGTADVDRTELGGNVLELGGFARLVHRHEIDRAIVLRAEFDTPGGLERFGRDLTDFPFPDLEDEVRSAWLELTIRFRTTATFRGPLVERAVIGIGDESEPLVWLEIGASLREGEPLRARLNLGHPLIAEAAEEIAEAWSHLAIPEAVLHGGLDGGGYGAGRGDGAGLGDGTGFGDDRSVPVFALSRSRSCALPPADEPLVVIDSGDTDQLRDKLLELWRNPGSAKERKRGEGLQEIIELRERTLPQVRTFLEMVVLGTISQLRSFLRDALYVGPLRAIPPRGSLYERPGRLGSWADGLAAWEALLADRGDLVARTNAWLRRLGAGSQLVVQQLFEPGADAEEIAASHVDKTVRRLLIEAGAGSLVLPSEVGAGISQVVPVVVAALDERAGFTLVEQPELHVHPAVQVGLGDLFIDAATRDGRPRMLLIETHSEHLILRLIRRIRETTDGALPSGAPAFSREQLSVLHVERGPAGVEIRRLRVDERGEFTDRWPRGFFEERAEELF